MPNFKKKPVEIEAHQWFQNGDHPEDYTESIYDYTDEGEILREYTPQYRENHNWEGDVVRYYRNPNDDDNRNCEHCEEIMLDHGWIDTLEGGHKVCPKDWIITGVQGERYPCKPDIFEKTYDKVE